MTSRLNAEFDSRLIRVSSGAGGITRPQISRNGALEKVYCLHCGKPGGGVTADMPAALRNDPGFIYICDACDARFPSPLPSHATGFAARKEWR